MTDEEIKKYKDVTATLEAISKMTVREAIKAADHLKVNNKDIAKAICWELVQFHTHAGNEGSPLHRLGLHLYNYIDDYGLSEQDDTEIIKFEEYLDSADTADPDFLPELVRRHEEFGGRLSRKMAQKIREYIAYNDI